MSKATYTNTLKRLAKVAADLKELGHPSLSMLVSSLANEVQMAEKKKTYIRGMKAELIIIDEAL